MRVIFAKKEALQALSISKNVAWDALTFHFEEIEKSTNCTRDTPILLTFKMFSVCKDFFMASMRPRLLVELSQA